MNTSYEELKKKISNDINNCINSVKEGSKKVVESWSYLPSTDDSGSRLDNPDVFLSVPSIITRNGYICETHVIISQGYVLNIHRIPHSKGGCGAPSKAVILQHGLLASSSDWILNGPKKALAYVLADNGYDVWMTNIRGNKYSREHVWLKNDSKSYWNFSWHDVAMYDIPTVIDYILELKGVNCKIAYIGHSMGTTILFAMLTLRPEYNKILKIGLALAPEVFLNDIKSPLKALAPMASNVAYMEMLYGSHEFIPKKSLLGKISSSCDEDKVDAVIRKNILFYICGYDNCQFNKALLPVFLAHLGTGTSWKTVLHYAQEVVSGGKFQQFDYGSSHNKQMYGTDTPPEYDLSKVTLPLVLFWSHNDLLSGIKDISLLNDKLPSDTTETYVIPFAEFNHLDYLWAMDAPKLLNEKVLQTLKKIDD